MATMLQGMYVDRRPGDWICTGCGDLQFRRNQSCRRCGRPNTGGAGPAVEQASAALAAAQAAAQAQALQQWEVAQAQALAEAQAQALLVQAAAPSGLQELTLGGGEEPPEKKAKFDGGMKMFQVAEDLVEGLVGADGNSLSEIGVKSETTVLLASARELDPSAPDVKVVCIRGTAEKITAAVELLTQKTTELQHAKLLAGFMQTPTPAAPTGLGSAAVAAMGTKTVPCKFHTRRPGSCKNGDNCMFSHDPVLIAAATGTAAAIAEGASGDAAALAGMGAAAQEMAGPALAAQAAQAAQIAHAAQLAQALVAPNMAETHASDYKVTYCKFWDSGRCSRGDQCIYAHGLEQLRGGLTPRNMQIMQEAHMMMVQMLQTAQGATPQPMEQPQQPQQPVEPGPRVVPAWNTNNGMAGGPGGGKGAVVPAAFRTAAFKTKAASGLGAMG